MNPFSPADVPPAYISRVAIVESGGNPSAKARTSSALGLYQFTTGTWNDLRSRYPELGLTAGGRTDPEQAERALRRFTADNAAVLIRSIGRQPTMSELYLAHFLGVGTALKVLKAPPSAACAPVVGRAAVRANAFLAPMSCAQLRAWARRKVPDAPAAAAVPVAKPAAPAPALPPAPPKPKPAPARPVEMTADELNARELRRIRGQA